MEMKFEGMNVKSLLKLRCTGFIAVAAMLLTLPNKASVHISQLRDPARVNSNKRHGPKSSDSA